MPKAGFYAVANGRQPGIYSTWDEARAQVEGYKSAKHKKFAVFEAAESYLAAHLAQPCAPRDAVESSDSRQQRRSAATRTRGQMHPYVIANRKPSGGAPLGTRRVYCDGACSNNGQSNALAGIGVFWEDQPALSLAERLPGEVQTNQKAELYAVLRVLESDPTPTEPLEIMTDSRYAINCLRVWHHKWAQCDWKTAGNKDVNHASLIQLILRKINLHPKRRLTLTHVRAHRGDPGNEQADQLAVNGARLPVAKPRDFERELEQLCNPSSQEEADILLHLDPDFWLTEEQLLNGDFDA